MPAWSAADKHWYADLVAHCQGSWCAPEEAHAVLAALNQRPREECLLMTRMDVDGRYEDTAGQVWADDAKGRWSSQISGKKVFLHHVIAELQPTCSRGEGDVGSHLCGFCNCVRLEHIGFQPKGEDIRDMRHHGKRKRGEIRSDSRVLAGLESSLTPARPPLLTPDPPARYRSPATSSHLK